MNLEQIDTSNTAGKRRVMELAEQGRRVAAARRGGQKIFGYVSSPNWNWEVCDFAIIAEPVGPEEVWAVVNGRRGLVDAYVSEQEAGAAVNRGQEKVKYIRADLAGEGK
jgi:hypothetical protein